MSNLQDIIRQSFEKEGITLCIQCGEEAKHRCSRCKQAGYCSVDCQKKNWPMHKAQCSETQEDRQKRLKSVYAKRIKDANDLIVGNISVIASHRFAKNGPGLIVVEIGEDIDDFCVPGSIHIAHLQYVPAANYELKLLERWGIRDAPKIQSDCARAIDVVYKFDNYVTNMIVASGNVDLVNLHKDHPDPTENWSIFFNM